MAYVIIFFAMFLVIGPVLWLRPSKRERELAALRQSVLQSGAKIQPMLLRKDSFYSGILDRNPHLNDHSWVRYQWIAKEKEKGPALKDSWIQRKDSQKGLVWEPQSISTVESDDIAAILAPWREQQDVRFLALELGPRYVSIVWNEKGSAEEVAALSESVRQLFLTS